MLEAREAADAREAMVAGLSRDVKDARVLRAIGRVPRECFVPGELRRFAYENRPLPIGDGQTISQPLIVAIMTEALQLEGGETVLEVGTGSGYQAAILSLLSRRVVSVERIPHLAAGAQRTLADLEFSNIAVHSAGEEIGWPEDGPYNAIIVTAASPEIPARLLDQLTVGGRLVIPVGSRARQELVRIVKTVKGAVRHNLGPCQFVPLLGDGGWPEAAGS